MGGKRPGRRKYIHLCIALLACSLISGCAHGKRDVQDVPIEEPQQRVVLHQEDPRGHLVKAGRLFAQGEYEASLQENLRALRLSAGRSPGDEAIFNMGLIAVHPGNPKKDQTKSLALFKRLLTEYPGSPWTDQAKIWIEVIQENEKAKRICAETTQDNVKLRQMIEESKKVDIEIEEKKRERAR